MPTPQITLTASLKDLAGAAAGVAANPAKLVIALCGFGLTLPRIVGTAMLAKIGPYALQDTGSGISTVLWGNDQINPVGTYYTITVIDGENNVVQCGMYRFTGTLTIDLSDAVQIEPVNSLAYSPTRGAVPGTSYTAPGPIIILFSNGIAQRPGVDYSLSADGATALLNYTTEDGDRITALCAFVSAGEMIAGAWLLQYDECTGAVPGTAYVSPGPVAAVALNGALLAPITDYTISGVNITLTAATSVGDQVFALTPVS